MKKETMQLTRSQRDAVRRTPQILDSQALLDQKDCTLIDRLLRSEDFERFYFGALR